ncbi:hypothetical protein CCH79_00000849 [Gambusia affinis]|uniref:Uncharacterized protein n=1 Tax=Gambusia affinis TaxID=33528 RepID=A0A315W429_GAMAF|nr:hypothetical protein CCH79_00000849 [Gambusia affinis]
MDHLSSTNHEEARVSKVTRVKLVTSSIQNNNAGCTASYKHRNKPIISIPLVFTLVPTRDVFVKFLQKLQGADVVGGCFVFIRVVCTREGWTTEGHPISVVRRHLFERAFHARDLTQNIGGPVSSYEASVITVAHPFLQDPFTKVFTKTITGARPPACESSDHRLSVLNRPLASNRPHRCEDKVAAADSLNCHPSTWLLSVLLVSPACRSRSLQFLHWALSSPTCCYRTQSYENIRVSDHLQPRREATPGLLVLKKAAAAVERNPQVEPNQNHQTLSPETILDSRAPIVTPIHILLEGITHTLEVRILIQVGMPGKIHQVIQEQGATQISIQEGILLEVTLQEDTLINQEEAIIQIKTQQEATLQADILQEDTLINQEEEIIQINIQLVEAIQLVDTPTKAEEGILTSTLPEGIIPTSTPEQVATQVVMVEVTVVATVEEQLAVTLTGTQIIKSSAPGSVVEVMDKGMGIQPKSTGFAKKAMVAAGVGALAGMAVGYGLGRFPRPHFAFRNPEEEYYYNNYMYRNYGTKSTDEKDYGRDYVYKPPPRAKTYENFMNECKNRTDLLKDQGSSNSGATDEDNDTVSIEEIGPVLWFAEEAQPVPCPRSSQHACCCRSCPLQALLGEALGWGRFIAITFTVTSGAASSLAERPGAQSSCEQHHYPE